MRFATAFLILFLGSPAHAGQVKEFLRRVWFGPPRQAGVARPPEAPPPPKVYPALNGRDGQLRRAFAVAQKLEGGHWKYPTRALLAFSANASAVKAQTGYSLARELEGGAWRNESLAVLTQSLASAGVEGAVAKRGYALAARLESSDNLSRALITDAYFMIGADEGKIERAHVVAKELEPSDAVARGLLVHAAALGGPEAVRRGRQLAAALDPNGHAVSRALLVGAYVAAGGNAARLRDAHHAAGRLEGASRTGRALLTHAILRFGEPTVRDGFLLAGQLEGGFLQHRSRALLTWAYGAAGGQAEPVRQGYALAKELDNGEWDNTSRALLTTTLFEKDAGKLVPMIAALLR